MSELSPDEPSIATVRAACTALTRGRTDLVAKRRRDRERKWRASAKAPPAESQHAPLPPELHEKSSVVAKPFASNRGIRTPNNWVPDEKWLPSLAENDGRNLTDEAARQINENVTGLFAVLAEWARVAKSPRRRTTSTTSPIPDGAQFRSRSRCSFHWAEQPNERTSNMNNLETNVPAIVTGAENILIAAQEDAGFDKILKFKKGDYFIGEQKVPLLTEYLAHPEAWTKCWTKFQDNRVADRRLYCVARGEKPPERKDLDEQDRVDLDSGP